MLRRDLGCREGIACRIKDQALCSIQISLKERSLRLTSLLTGSDSLAACPANTPTPGSVHSARVSTGRRWRRARPTAWCSSASSCSSPPSGSIARTSPARSATPQHGLLSGARRRTVALLDYRRLELVGNLRSPLAANGVQHAGQLSGARSDCACE